MKINKFLIGLILTVVLSVVFFAIILGKHNREKYALFNAAEVDDLAKVKLLIQQGAPINEKVASVFGFTPLIGAIYHDSTNTAGYLVDAGADVNLADNNGVTPLMWVAAHGDAEVSLAKILIAHGANLDAKDKLGGTALAAAKGNPPAPELIEVLNAAKIEQENKSHK